MYSFIHASEDQRPTALVVETARCCRKAADCSSSRGPSDSTTAVRRHDGLVSGLRTSGVEIRTALRGDWTARSAEAAVTSWLRLKLTEGLRIDAVFSQNDEMASCTPSPIRR